jgi:hypothetical protein
MLFHDPFWVAAVQWLRRLSAAQPTARVLAPSEFVQLFPQAVPYRYGVLRSLSIQAILAHKGRLPEIEPIRRLALLTAKPLAANQVFVLFGLVPEMERLDACAPADLPLRRDLLLDWTYRGIPAQRSVLD